MRKRLFLAAVALLIVVVVADAAFARGRRGRRGGNDCGDSYGGYAGAYHGHHHGMHDGHGSHHAYGSPADGGRYSFYPGDSRYQRSQPEYSAANSGREIRLRVIVPDSQARVWVDDSPTQQRGTNRLFVSPPIEHDRACSYVVRASWMDNGREVKQERTVAVHPGQLAMVNFTERQRETIGNPQDGSGKQPERVEKATPDANPARDEKTHEGKVLQANQNQLTMTDLKGENRHTHMVAVDAKITCDGKTCQLEDLREGYRVRVTTRNEDTVIRIDATSPK
jgi:uncharacterized protein (TIGR03000 family)